MHCTAMNSPLNCWHEASRPARRSETDRHGGWLGL